MKPNMLPFLFAVLLCIIAPASVKSAELSAEDNSVRVAFINPGYGDRGFWKDVRDTMQAAADQFGYELIVFDSNRKSNMMIENAQKVFALEPAPDYIIAVNEHQQGVRIVLEAEEHGIPVIMLLNDLTDEQKATYGGPGKGNDHWIMTLTPDNERAGYDIARSLIDGARMGRRNHQPESLCLLSLAGDRQTPASLQRLRGLDHALSQFPVLKEERRAVANWSYEEAYHQTESWLDEGGCVDVVWAANDDIALGAIAALEKAGRTPGKDVFVSGLNWSTDGLQRIADGQMTMTHGGHFFAGAWVMVLLHDYIQGVEILHQDPQVSFRMEAITRSLLPCFADLLDERDWSNLDYRSFSIANSPSGTKYSFVLHPEDGHHRY